MSEKKPSLVSLFVFAFFIICFALHPFSPFYTHHLADPDDYMRLNEVISWLQGQGWYDLSVPRLSPGARTIIHWSRLVDLPIATLMLPFIPVLGITNAALVASFIAPLFWLALLLILLPRLTRFVTDTDSAPLSCILLLFMPMLLFNYTPGRVDHHGIQALIAGFGVLSLCQIIRDHRARLFAILSGLFFACGLWISVEIMPALLLFLGCLTLICVFGHQENRRNAACFGFSFALSTIALIPIALPRSEFSSRALSWLSPAYAIFAVLAGSVLIVGYYLNKLICDRKPHDPSFRKNRFFWRLYHVNLKGRKNFRRVFELRPHFYGAAEKSFFGFSSGRTIRRKMRFYRQSRLIYLLFYLLLTLCAAATFLTLIPAALHGPFTDYDTFDATTALENISEAQPLSHAFHVNRYMPTSFIPAFVAFLRLLFLPVSALVFSAWQSVKTRQQNRLIWMCHSLFLSGMMLLTLFAQIRLGIYMELFTLAPLTALLRRSWTLLAKKFTGRILFASETTFFLTFSLIPALLIPAAIAKTPLYPDLILFPAARAATKCDLAPVIPFLNETDGVGSQPHTIMNSSDTGPQLLFETRHNVIAGNFDVPGNADTYNFFHATDDNTAQKAAQNRHADLVLICRAAPQLYLGRGYYKLDHAHLQIGTDGLLHLANTDTAQPLIQRLITGDIPPWLKQIEIPVPSDYLLFTIEK